ncbi:MAG: 4-hydroxybenzoate 3-monooxygenase [Acidimicrobiia bacterium]
MRTQVAIIGAGPAGTTLSLLLHRHGIESVVLERQSREYVLGRIRAGVLEWSSVEILERIGVAEHMHAEGHVHGSIKLGWRGDELLEINMRALAGRPMMAYGQTALQEDLYRRADQLGVDVRFEVTDVELLDVTSDHPYVTFVQHGERERIDCDVIAGCDGFHGVSRPTIPASVVTEYEKSYPFGWLGILSETPPLPTLVYANHERGFALCSERNPMLSRYYVQCSLDDSIEDWSDDRFWSELLARVPRVEAAHIVTGPSTEKSIAPLRSYVIEPMQWGNLCLAGDAAHIVPPTGAKGLNLALSDVHYLSEAIAARSRGDHQKFADYSATALRRVWASVRFSWWMTMLLHRFPEQTAFDQRTQEEELIHLASSTAAQTALAEQYTGLPLHDSAEDADAT